MDVLVDVLVDVAFSWVYINNTVSQPVVRLQERVVRLQATTAVSAVTLWYCLLGLGCGVP